MIFLCLETIKAQTGEEAQQPLLPSPGAKEASISFDKLLNRYHWDTHLLLHHTIGKVSLFLDERFLSSIIKSDRTFIRDENRLDMKIEHPLSDRLAGMLRTSSYALSDDQTIALGKAGSHTIQYGVTITPIERFTLLPMLGFRHDTQLGINDNGLSYNLDVHATGLEFDGYSLSMNGINERSHLTPRMLETYRDTLGVQKLFFERTLARFSVSYFRNRRDFYTGSNQATLSGMPSSPGIETRLEEAIAFTTAFDYAAGKSWIFNLSGALGSREITRTMNNQQTAQPLQAALNPGIEELRIEGYGTAQYSPDKSFFLSAGISIIERDERHGITPDGIHSAISLDSAAEVQERKNNKALQTALSLDLAILPSLSDTIRLSLSNNLLRYDTPSLINDDDRDELRHAIRLLTKHRINQYLSADVTAEVSLSHLVYLEGSRSSENTWNRIFRLSPRLSYTPSHIFTTTNKFEVLANYTVYDFEYVASSVQSFTFRQFAWIDSSVLALTKRLALDWYNNIRLYERGELRWQEFTERPLTLIEEHTYTGSTRYMINELLLFSIGIRYFSQTRYAYAGADKKQEFFLRSVGPLTAIDWKIGARTHLMVKGWYENLYQTGKAKSNNANITMDCIVHL